MKLVNTINQLETNKSFEGLNIDDVLQLLKELEDYRNKNKRLSKTEKGYIPKMGKVGDNIEYSKLTSLKNDIVNSIEFVFRIGMESSLFGLEATVYDVLKKKGFDLDTIHGDAHATFEDYILKYPDETFEVISEKTFLERFF